MLKTQNVSIQFYNQASLSFPDIELMDEEQCVLVGDSGSGKTTLLHVIGGLLKANQGTIDINKHELSQMSQVQLDQYRGQNIGMIFQKNYLIGALNVFDNIALAQRLAKLPKDAVMIDSILKELDIYEKRSDKIKSLSHGQAQRVAIARALINKPKLILADEPTASLDDTHAGVVLDMLKNQAKRYSANLIIATHDQRVKAMFEKEIKINYVEHVLA